MRSESKADPGFSSDAALSLRMPGNCALERNTQIRGIIKSNRVLSCSACYSTERAQGQGALSFIEIDIWPLYLCTPH
jgi:hypothetical protein